MGTDENLIRYYSARAPEYEEIYERPERQRDLVRLRRILTDLTSCERVLELACGTGFWTRVMARSASAVHAVDASYESVEIARGNQFRRQVVQPYSNYLAGRVHKDWNKGNTSLGGMLTSTHRWIDDPALAFLPRDALTGGVDFVQYFANRSWTLQAKGVVSQVTGDPEAILDLQTNPVHYFQRPDAHIQSMLAQERCRIGHGDGQCDERCGDKTDASSESCLGDAQDENGRYRRYPKERCVVRKHRVNIAEKGQSGRVAEWQGGKVGISTLRLAAFFT